MTYVSMIVALVVITALLYFLLKQKALTGGKTRKSGTSKKSDSLSDKNTGGLNVELVQNKWRDIVAMQSNGPSGIKNALIEADKLLDYVMIQKGFTGDTMGDRLKSGGSAFGDLNGIWSAHKLRNRMAHDIEHDMIPDEFRRAIASLAQGIKDLGVRIT